MDKAEPSGPRPSYPPADFRRRAIPGIVRCCDFVPIPMLDIASRELRERLRTGSHW